MTIKIHDIAIFTIASNNYLAYVRVLMNSIKEFHDDVDLHLLLADEVDGAFDKTAEAFHVKEARELGIPSFEHMAFTYDILEFNTAVKPFFIKYLFEQGYKKVIYFDPDIVLVNRLDELFGLLDSYSLVVIPHMTVPIPEGDHALPNEQQLLLLGTFNLGFIALSASPETITFYDWWCRKCATACYVEVETGLFVDQKWINAVPGFFESVYILRHKGYNMAYWNLHERILNGLMVNGVDPLVFFHFSGIVLHDLNLISKHQNRYTLDTRKDLVEIYERYRDLLLENGHDLTKQFAYKYRRYHNGISIGPAARRLYSLVADKYPHPFQDGPGSFFELLRRKHLLEKDIAYSIIRSGATNNLGKSTFFVTLLNFFLKSLKLILGMKKYRSLMLYMQQISTIRKQDFLIK
jgi:hypothetical protein